ncbi:sigma-70 family RNA polymerase sigma factor [Candidatus Poribacteria bacterium]|nr:sigma-70 family RNA polymerase sigma factor [Candidatus Poribacteria bacterium]
MRSADDQLVQQCLEGDKEAFGVLVHKYQEMVYAYAFQKVRNDADAEDIAQEVFFRAYRHLNQLKSPHQFRSWLYTIMSNECNRWLARASKNRSRETPLEDATGDVLLVEPEYAKTPDDWRMDLEQALEELPEDNRVAVSMFYMSDCSLKEIGEFLGVSVNTVKGKLHRARQQLGKALAERYGNLMKDHQLKGGFLMQVMEQLRRIPCPAVPPVWQGLTIRQISLTVVTALCVLIGVLGQLSEPQPEQLLIPHRPLLVRDGTDAWATLIDVTLWGRTERPPVPPVTVEKPADGQSRVENRTSPLQVTNAPATAANQGKGDSPDAPMMAAAPPSALINAGEKITVSGKVVTKSGSPVSDARVYFFEENYTGKDVPQLMAQTTANGVFQFDIPKPEAKKWEQVQVIVYHPQYAFNWTKLTEENVNDLTIVLGQSTAITGKVTNESRSPLENVRVKIVLCFPPNAAGFGREWLRGEAIPTPIVQSDANGNFVLPNLPADHRMALHAIGAGYAVGVQGSVVAGTEEVSFVLKPEGLIKGRVTFDKTGAPAKGIKIAVQGLHPTPPPGWGEVETDENGYYAITNLVEGTYNVFLREDSPDWTAIAREYVEVKPGSVVKNMDLELIEGGWITGKVIDEDTNEPITGHWVACYDAARPESQAAVHGTNTDENGFFRFRAAPGKARVYTSKPEGYQDAGQVTKYVEVVEGETIDDIVFAFRKGIDLIGRVLTFEGEPVAGAKITDRTEFYWPYNTTTDRDGKFALKGLRAGQKLSFKAQHRELQLRGYADVEVQPGAEAEILAEKYETTSVSGRVVDKQGEPVPSANIGLTRWDRVEGHGTGSTAAVADGEGKFRITGLIIGDEYYVGANAKGYRGARTEMFTVSAEMETLEDLVLLPQGRFFLEGRVTNTNGNPIARAQVSAMSEQNMTHTDENGRYRFENLPFVVETQVQIHHPDYGHYEFRYIPTNQTQDFTLIKADQYLSGKVVDPDGNPVEKATVFVDDDSGASERVNHVNVATDTNLQGEFHLKHILEERVPIYVGKGRTYRIIKDVKTNQEGVIFVLKADESSAPKPWTPEQEARRQYRQSADERLETMKGQPAPEFDVDRWVSGEPVRLAELKGKVVVLFFWSSGQVQDVEATRLLQVLHDVYGEKGLVCVAIHEPTDSVGELKELIAEKGLTFPNAVDKPIEAPGAKGVTFDRYAIVGSWFIVIDPEGISQGRVWGSELEKKIQELLPK